MPAIPPELGPPVRHVVVHHTQIFAEYEPAEAAGLVANLCESHVEQRGFDDLGYHLIIDRYGVVHEGRAGGLSRPIVGAHAQGFNHGTIGVALMGDFDVSPVPDAAKASLARVIAWLSRLHGFDPAASLPYASTGGPKSRFEDGEVVQAPGILAHRRVGLTSCPGRHLEAYVDSGALLQDVQSELGGAIPTASPPTRGTTPPAPVDQPDPEDGAPGVIERIADVVERIVIPRGLRP